MGDGQWHWQQFGTAWKGVGIYHVTLVVSSREPLLGTLVIPNNNPQEANVDLSPFGEQIKSCVRSIPEHHPEIKIIGLRMMPDHVHFILHVTRDMPVSIKSAIRGFWQGAKMLGRAYSLSISPNAIRDNQQRSHPIFTDMPFIRPLSRRGQLDTMIQYVKMNPQRLATKRLMPGYFRVQQDIEIAGVSYDGVGNVSLLQAERYMPVHVRRMMVEAAEYGDAQALRNYMNSCVLAARQGSILVSPFISPQERQVMDVLLREKLPFIYLADNGFHDYYKPQTGLFDACAEGRLLILSPWKFDPNKGHISRSDCVALNNLAASISSYL